MSQQKAFDNIMNYFIEEEDEDEEEEEEENYISIMNRNKSKEISRKKNLSLKQVDSNLAIDKKNEIINDKNSLQNEESEKDEINDVNNINNSNNNLIKNSSEPETQKITKINNILENNDNNEGEKEKKNIENNDNNIDESIFSETLKTKIKDINSNNLDIPDNNNNNENNILENHLTTNLRQTFHKNINSDKNIDLNKDIHKNELNNIDNNNDNNIKEKEKNNNFLLIESFNNKKSIINNDENDTINTKSENNIIITNYENKYNEKIEKRKMLFLELQKNREKIKEMEKLKLLENLEDNNVNDNEMEKHNDKNNNSNNIKLINFGEIKEIYNNKTNENEFNNNDYYIIDKDNNNNIIKKEINSKDLDKLVSPIYYDEKNEDNLLKNNIKRNKSLIHIKNKNTIIKNNKYLKMNKSYDSLNNIKNINKSSYKKLSEHNEKLISKIIDENSIDNKNLSILGIIKSLYHLNILHELLFKENKDNYLELNKLKEIIKKVNKEEKGKMKEIEFVEQIWFLLNPNNKECINKEIFEGFINLLYPYSDLKNSKINIISYLKEYIKIVNFMEPINNNEKEIYYYYSPLRDIFFYQNEIWTLEKIIDIFFELKKNILAYKKTYYRLYTKKSHNNEINNKINNNDNKNKKKFDFDKLYNTFKIKNEIREKTLEMMREEQKRENEEKLTKFTYIPKIIKRYKFKNNINKNNLTVYENLYRRRNDKKKIIEKLKDDLKEELIEKKKKEKENYTFKPNIIKMEKEDLKKKFKINKVPNGYNQYINRNRKIINLKEEEKLKEKNKYDGSNYEKVKKIKFKCEGNLYNPKNKEKKKEEEKEQKDKENIEISIKLLNNKIARLKLNKNDDINQKVENFCKIFCLNSNYQQILIKGIKNKICNINENNIDLNGESEESDD